MYNARKNISLLLQKHSKLSHVIRATNLIICIAVLSVDAISLVHLFLLGEVTLISKIEGWFLVTTSQWFCGKPYTIVLQQLIMDILLIIYFTALLLGKAQNDERYRNYINISLLVLSTFAVLYLFATIIPNTYTDIQYHCPTVGE